MREISQADAGMHCQKSELRNDYNRLLKLLDKQNKLFIDDRNSRSVAVMISYGLYRDIVDALKEIEQLQDEADLRTAVSRGRDGSKPLSSADFRERLRKIVK